MSIEKVRVGITLANGEIDTVEVQVFQCDKCLRQINASKEPVIIDQSCVTIIHPSGYDEVVMEPNCKQGFLNHYCVDCTLEADGIPFFSDKERANVLKAITRRYEKEGYEDRNPRLKAKMVAKLTELSPSVN